MFCASIEMRMKEKVNAGQRVVVYLCENEWLRNFKGEQTYYQGTECLFRRQNKNYKT